MAAARILESLHDLAAHLAALPVTPLVRELRTLHRRYETTVRAWSARPPREDQLLVMTELVRNLEERAGATPRTSGIPRRLSREMTKPPPRISRRPTVPPMPDGDDLTPTWRPPPTK